MEIYDHGEVKFGAIAMEDAVTVSIVRMILVFGVAGTVSAVLIVFLRPWMQRYALARPNARSSHTIPTPQASAAIIYESKPNFVH